MQSGANWGGQAAKLLKKVTQVEGAAPSLQKREGARWTLPVHTLTFANPGGEKTMPSLGCRIDYGDVVKVEIPDYKPKSYSMSSARPGEFDITFKVYPGGRCSGYLDSIKVGESVNVFKRGANERQAGTHVGMVAFGVGITEALPIAKAELEKKDAVKVHLLWAARKFEDMFWHREIKELHEKHEEAFQVTRILSQEDREGCLKGRVDVGVLESVFGGWKDHVHGVRFLVVGTKPMMRECESNLTKVGFPWPACALLLKPKKDKNKNKGRT